MTNSDEHNVTDSEHWEIYVTYVEDKPAVIMVDIGLAEHFPIADLNQLAWLWVHIASPDEEGFPSEEEDIKLNEVEDHVTEALHGSDARYVGRITTDGRREFYFYTKDPAGFQATVVTVMQTFPHYEIEIDEADDAEWQHYAEVLCPSPEDFQQINNNHLISRLEMAGDSLTVPRRVDHFANFKTEEDREAFVASASGHGYEAVSRPERDPESDFPYAVGLLRVDPVDPETIDNITYELFELARQHEGEYEGWSSPVVK